MDRSTRGRRHAGAPRRRGGARARGSPGGRAGREATRRVRRPRPRPRHRLRRSRGRGSLFHGLPTGVPPVHRSRRRGRMPPPPGDRIRRCARRADRRARGHRRSLWRMGGATRCAWHDHCPPQPPDTLRRGLYAGCEEHRRRGEQQRGIRHRGRRPQRLEALRRHRCRERFLVRCETRRGPRVPRSERLGKAHHDAHDPLHREPGPRRDQRLRRASPRRASVACRLSARGPRPLPRCPDHRHPLPNSARCGA